MSALAPTNAYVPRVTKSLLQGPRSQDIAHLDDSDTLISIVDGLTYISFDDGESWKAAEAVRKGVRYIYIDPFHKGRAFVGNEDEIYVTEDHGKSWKELHIPKAANEHILFWMFQTHPVARNLLLFPAYELRRPVYTVIWTSNDSGQSFKRIIAPDTASNFQMLDYCCFVASRESTLANNGIYYVYPQPIRNEESRTTYTKHILFYTPDFGKTTKGFNEFNDSSVQGIFIFPSSVFVTTKECGWEWKRSVTKLWISKGESFEPVRLPNKVISLEDACKDDETHLLLIAKVNDCESNYLLILDPLNLNFFFRGPVPWSDGLEYFGQLGNLKGTLWGVYSRWDSEDLCYVTKASFDNGESWTNLKVVDPSGIHRHLFEYDINDLERCSFQESIEGCKCCNPYVSQNEPTAGIIIKRGTVGRNTNVMTFISRDGGASWEIAFEFPVYAACLDFGNIVVAMPREEIYTRFFFSLDQGRTWNEYYFDEPIEADLFSIYSLGLKAVIAIDREKDGSKETVFYSLDFSNIFGGVACTKDDLERWYLYDGKCIDGVRYSFDRRKPDAKCLVRRTFKELKLHEEKCLSV